MRHVVIIGNGIAGISCARYVRKYSDFRITVVSAETKFFFSRTALMYIYMGHMAFSHTKPYEDSFWRKNRITLAHDRVERVSFDEKRLQLRSGASLVYDDLVIASGSVPFRVSWPGVDLPGVQSLYSYQDLQLMDQNTKGIKEAVVVGGGLIGIEMAEMLRSRGIGVTYLVREESFWCKILPAEESQMINRHIGAHHVDLRLSTELKEVVDENGRVGSIITNKDEQIACQFVGVTIGVVPNVAFLKETPLAIGRGILVERDLRTNIPNVYAIGDCAELREPQPGRRALEPVWYTGRIMGKTVARTLTGTPTVYAPGVWFNSAKFFDIEYQTYGTVSSCPEGQEQHFYWEDAGGTRSLRIAYQRSSCIVLGCNAMGLRQRHEVWDRWIREKKHVAEVIEDLALSNFDPEFFTRFEDPIREKFYKDCPSFVIQKADDARS